MSTHIKPAELQGVQIGELTIDGRRLPAFIFNYSRSKQVPVVFIWLLLAVACAFMFKDAEKVNFVFIGKSPTLAHVVAGIGFTICFTLAALMVRQIFQAPFFIALCPLGLQVAQNRKAFFLSWEDIAAATPGGVANVPSVAIKLTDYVSKESLRPFARDFETNMKSHGVHILIPSAAYEASPKLVEFAVPYFFNRPEKRALAGTEDGLNELASAFKIGN